MPDEVFDSPTGWVASHIHEYVQSDGAKGHMWNGVPTLLLTTRGRKSGLWRRTALIYGQIDAGYVVIGSQGGADTHPHWYLNLAEDPTVTIQVGPEVMAARARDATPRERPGLWDMMAEIFPRYLQYQARTERQIPVVVIEPESR